MMIKNLVRKLKAMNDSSICTAINCTVKNATDTVSIKSLKGMTRQALDLYTRKNDIKNFTKLALSNPEDKSHNEIITKLFDKKSITDALDEYKIETLAKNKKLFKDLGL